MPKILSAARYAYVFWHILSEKYPARIYQLFILRCTRNQSDSNFLSMAIMKDKAGTASYQDKADYLSAAYALMDDMKTLGNWDGYLRYGKWINDILAFCKVKS